MKFVLLAVPSSDLYFWITIVLLLALYLLILIYAIPIGQKISERDRYTKAPEWQKVIAASFQCVEWSFSDRRMAGEINGYSLFVIKEGSEYWARAYQKESLQRFINTQDFQSVLNFLSKHITIDTHYKIL